MKARLRRSVRTQNLILRLLAQGLNRKEVAAELGLSVKGLEWYWRRIQQRLGVRDKFNIAVRAVRLGIV